MQVPETPQSVEHLDLMKRLKSYADGEATWHKDGSDLGVEAMQACLNLYNNLVQLVNNVFAPLLDRVTAREMETYTMHDRVHGLKVAHLMWHILEPETRLHLTPPEIGLLLCSAHLHDLGMGLSPEERQARLDSSSDLWDRLELLESTRVAFEDLQAQVGSQELSASARISATRKLFQAEEALLTQDTRARHATPERYAEILNSLSQMHNSDPVRMPDIKASLSFDGFSFREKLIDICVSHNEDAEALVEADKKHSGRRRFPRDYPIGCANADLHMVAATLRLADILDFDRERTPPALFHYLLPGPLAEPDNDSGREWGKHMAISNWHIDNDAIVFKGMCKSHIIHHAIVLFASAIENEIAATRTTFGALQEVSWPCRLPSSVKVDIHEDGYRYVPYKFEFDDDRVYSLLMGGAIYQNPLDAVRELVQNAVDACKLRDALTQLYDESQPKTINRILIQYEEPTGECSQPRLRIKDTGTGMDALILERYFLKVGRSYYSSTEFNQTRIKLRKSNLDFAPVSEFGIGFLSSFLLANRVEVETAMWESHLGDTTKRLLQIDGPTRLIRLSEERNEGPQRLKGTRITVYLSHGGGENKTEPPTWDEIKSYLEKVCQDLPYRLNLEYVSEGHVTKDLIDPLPLKVDVPSDLEPFALRIPVDDKESGLEGEIVFINGYARYKARKDRVKEGLISVKDGLDLRNSQKNKNIDWQDSALLRGGFYIGGVPGLPDTYDSRSYHTAKLRLKWEGGANRRYLKTNLARNSISGLESIQRDVSRLWLTYLIENMYNLPEGIVHNLGYSALGDKNWLQHYDALRLYEFASLTWHLSLLEEEIATEEIKLWESGTGQSLPLLGGLTQSILDLILPRVTSLQTDHEYDVYAKPPSPDWRATLSGCRDYITNPIKWEVSIEYIGEIKEDFYQFNADRFNSHYVNLLESFQPDELIRLKGLLDDIMLAASNDEQAELTSEQADLLQRLQRVAGNLEIGYRENRWRIDSFKISQGTI